MDSGNKARLYFPLLELHLDQPSGIRIPMIYLNSSRISALFQAPLLPGFIAPPYLRQGPSCSIAALTRSGRGLTEDDLYSRCNQLGSTSLVHSSAYEIPFNRRDTRAHFGDCVIICERTIVYMEESTYSVEGVLFHQHNAQLSDHFCRDTISLIATLACLGDFTGNALAVFRIFVIWNRNKRVLISLLAGSLAALATSTVFAAIIDHKIQTTVVIQWALEPINSCVILPQSSLRFYYMAVWASQIVFDLYAVCLVFFNALSIPRKYNRSIWETLYEDGIVLMLAAFTLRLISIILATQPTLHYVYGVTINAAIVAALNCRLVLNLLETRSATTERPELVEHRTKTGQSYFVPRSPAEDHQSTFETFFSDSPLPDRDRQIKFIKALALIERVSSWGSA